MNLGNGDIEHLVTALRQLGYASSAFQGQQGKMDLVGIQSVYDALLKCGEPFAKMGLKTSSGMILEFLDSARRNSDYGDWTGDQFAEKCYAVFSAIQCETMGLFCFKMENENAKFFDKTNTIRRGCVSGLS